MSQTPEIPPAPPPPEVPPSASPPAVPPTADPRGSLGLGIVIAWACLIGGYFAVGVFVSALGGLLTGGSDVVATIAVLSALTPWIAMLVFAIRLAQKGKTRTALGVGVGFASILGVLLLLAAACFGLLATSNFH